ncbi:zinc ribbon domain-containing protein [Nocardioides sp.]|uniref:zinc ribbon domain-containing protein n=1 Tax=Nocardioides sp. TaxID=35761 RepID=UPI0031FEE77D|nr:hypothetical protein [Nocardioides sp.]
MEFCTRCGHELGVGRFCTNCGHPIESRNPAAHVPAAPLTRPAPPVARYPLFADQVHPGSATPHRRPRPPPWLVWAVAGGLSLTLVATLGAFLLLGGDNPGDDRATGPGPTHSPRDTEPTTAPTSPGKSTKPSTTPPGQPEDVAAIATVDVPATAPPNQDVSGNQVRYEGRNMLDGVPETCWRMPGDGTGAEITISLAEPTLISRVGLVNGYAKTALGAGGAQLDWYRGNRRILAVAWVFDDGTVVDQDLAQTRRTQSVDVEPVTTSLIRLRILQVSPPGSGPAARNYTPISDVELVGMPG